MKTTKKKPAKKTELERIPDGQYVMGLDVSSSAAGWAVACRNGIKTTIIDFGVFKPPKHWDATRRIEMIVQQISSECCERIATENNQPSSLRIAMEWQSHLRAAKNRSANGLATLGKSQGAVWWELKSKGFEVDHVSERVWTRVNGWPAPKKDRAKLIRLAVPEYRKAIETDASLDPGLDIADAIGLTLYRLTI